ncbi:MAG TPA: RsmG family class I SAM-dependent methyltransferase, partial [Lichenihabitans sp.]|nr:RsmG family class I SAM-dependent methyltransferase [Lichenihabitans sp.]
VHLVESNARKCAFLREAARESGAAAIIHNARIENVTPTLEYVDVVTARALAPLPDLLEMGKIPLSRGASGLFLKSAGELGAIDIGQLASAISVLPSLTSAEGRIVLVRPDHRAAPD